MMNLLQTLAAAAMLISLTVAASSSVLAGADSPFYPDNFNNPTLPHVPVGAGSGIPAPYRLSD